MCLRKSDFIRILRCASEAGISDVHLTADEPVCWRRGDVLSHLKEYVPTEKDIYELFKLMVKEEDWEKMHQDSAVNCAWEMDSWRYRVHAYRKRGKIAFAIRTLPRQIPELEKLGQAGIVGNFREMRQGLLLVTGATGAGKSTTVAALLENLNRTGNFHILTLEDPVEFLFSSDYGLVSQLEKGVDFKDYFQAVENAMRQGPDIIMVSELRDYRTAQAVLNAAVSGHYVVAPMHAGRVIEAVERIISMHPEPQQAMARSLLAASLQGVCTQKLLPGRGGVKQCAVECLHVNHAARNIIRSGRYEQLYNIIQSGISEGMQTMDMAVDMLRRGNLLRRDFGKALSAG